MDRERLTELLENPLQVGQEDLPALRSMTERFPWFSGAHLLLATGEHTTGDVLFTEHLRITAAHLPSRTNLFELVQEGSKVKMDLSPPASSAANAVLQEGAKVKMDPPSPHHVEGSETAFGNQAHVEEVGVATKTRPIDRRPAEPEIQASPEEDPLDAQIRQAAWVSNFDLARSSPLEPPAPPLTHGQDELRKSVMPTPLPSTESSTDGSVSNVTEARIPPGERKLKFTDWLEQDPSSILAMSNQGAKEEKAAMERREALEKADAQALLDRFIQRSDTPATATKVPFFNPHQTAKRSLLDDGMVSETLAKVHEQQGNFAKAIEVYDRLAMKHPEKSIYFAALSKALSGRSNK